MYQLIFALYHLIFAALFCNLRGSENSSYSSEEFDEAYEVSQKSKNNASSKKKKPKRNRSAFIIFSSEMRAKLRSEHKEKLNSNEMMVKLAELWKNLGEDEKKKYYDQAESEKVRYNAELSNFYQQNPFEVIQNKTKKNHIKKPCSAYAIYLKETKKDIKAENPDLKMADILKVVAEKWKKLTDTERIVFQKKALIEKEITQAKINQQQNLSSEPVVKASSKKESPKKQSTNSNKRSHKSVESPIQSSVEQESSEIKAEYEYVPEPSFVKHQIMNYNYNFYGQNIQENVITRPITWEGENMEFNYNNYLAQQQQPLYQNYEPNLYFKQPAFKEEFSYSNYSNLLSYLPQNTIAKPIEPSFYRQSNHHDLMVKRDEFSDDEEPLASTATMNSNSNEWHSSAKSLSPFAADSLIGNVEDDFKLDDQEFDSFNNRDLWTGERCL